MSSEQDISQEDGTHKAKEIGGYKGQDPTKYGDWQHKGRVSDF